MSGNPPAAEKMAQAVQRLLAARSADSLEAMAALIQTTDSAPLRNVDAWERIIRQELLAAESGLLGAWKFWLKSVRFASWLDLCHANGRRREAILRSANGAAPNGLFLALAVRRLNDWVPEVRAAARENLPRVVRASAPEHVADALWAALAHYTSWGRVEAPDRAVLFDLIGLDESARALLARLKSATAGPAPTVLAQASSTPVFDASLNEIAAEARQPAVRALAYQFLFAGEASWIVGRNWVWTSLKWCRGRYEHVLDKRTLTTERDVPELLHRAAHDSSAMVRRVGADALIQHMTSQTVDARALAQKLAVDRNESVAERGRYALKNVRPTAEQDNRASGSSERA